MSRKPRIIKVRMGFNANSSSLAAFVTYFLWGSAAAVLLINTISAVIFAGGARRAEKKNERPEG